MKYNIKDFITWGMTHTQGQPDAWHYLFGSVRVQTTPAALDMYRKAYIARGWDGAAFDAATADWQPTDYATDCQGLLDAWLTYEQGQKTDINADMNYRSWCTDKSEISGSLRPWQVGEAVFTQSKSTGKMTHVGWVCGIKNGDPLILEARGLKFGVVISRLSERNFTHRGLMTKVFDYKGEEPEMVKFEIATPMHTGAAYKLMQTALNAAGYTDADGKKLVEDGKWGKKSQYAFDGMVKEYSPETDIPITADNLATVLINGLRVTIAKE